MQRKKRDTSYVKKALHFGMNGHSSTPSHTIPFLKVGGGENGTNEHPATKGGLVGLHRKM